MDLRETLQNFEDQIEKELFSDVGHILLWLFGSGNLVGCLWKFTWHDSIMIYVGVWCLSFVYKLFDFIVIWMCD